MEKMGETKGAKHHEPLTGSSEQHLAKHEAASPYLPILLSA